MKLMRKTGLTLAVAVLVGLIAQDAAAQAPVITWQQSGNTLRVDWTAVAGATSYDVFVQGVPNSPFNTPVNFVVVSPAPAGTYVLAVRGRNGGTVGELSTPATITVTGGAGPGTCLPLTAPTIGSSVVGNVVTITWGAVPGAIGYRLQVGTSPGATQVSADFGAGQLSYSAAVPLLGTFYARVFAGNACGVTLSSSPDHAFTIGAATPGPAPTPPAGGGSGPRTPDPTPATGVLCVAGRPDLGYCIPVSSLGYARGVVNQVAAQNPFDVRNSCHAEGGNMNFVFKAVSALRRIDTRWGMNLKRGNQGDSEDIIAFNPTDRPDNGESQIYLFDIIGGHCGPNPIVDGLNDVTGATWPQGLANTPGCSTRFCAAWTLDSYLRAGFQP